jgi:hypothetical protein
VDQAANRRQNGLALCVLIASRLGRVWCRCTTSVRMGDRQRLGDRLHFESPFSHEGPQEINFSSPQTPADGFIGPKAYDVFQKH